VGLVNRFTEQCALALSLAQILILFNKGIVVGNLLFRDRLVLLLPLVLKLFNVRSNLLKLSTGHFFLLLD
jgi:hypothetical protein